MKTFLICHCGALGDFILTWPALSCLRQLLPDYEFLGVGRSEYMQLAISMGLLDSCLEKESAGLLDFFSGKSLPVEIGRPHGAVLWLSKGQETVNLLKEFSSLPVVCITPFPPLQTHIAHYYCLCIRSHFPINIPGNLSDCFPSRVKEGKYALIHPGSGSPKKNYSVKFYLGLAEELRRFSYKNVGFVFGPVEQERMRLEDFAGEWVIQPKNVQELADLLDHTAIYIGNDSGASHLSGYSGTPTIALYKTTNPEIWGIIGRNVIHVSATDEQASLLKIREYLSGMKEGKIRFDLK